MNRLLSARWLFALLASAVLLSACKEESDEPLPEDGAPTVIRQNPSDPSRVVVPNETVALAYVFADNEQLGSFSLRFLVEATGQDVQFAGDTLTGTQVNQQFTFSVPDTFPIGLLTRAIIRATVSDNQGNQDSVDLLLDINTPLPDTCTDGSQYSILTYTGGDTLYNAAGDPARASYDLLQRIYAITDDNADIREATAAAGSFAQALVSPNTSGAAVFKVFAASEFNYDLATWCSLDQAFRTHTPSSQTNPLEVGDLVVIDLNLIDGLTPGKAHYAVLRILALNDAPGEANDYIVFEYKRTENN